MRVTFRIEKTSNRIRFKGSPFPFKGQDWVSRSGIWGWAYGLGFFVWLRLQGLSFAA